MIICLKIKLSAITKVYGFTGMRRYVKNVSSFLPYFTVNNLEENVLFALHRKELQALQYRSYRLVTSNENII